jgi:hypothetical protein
MREQEKPVFQRTTDTLTATREFVPQEQSPYSANTHSREYNRDRPDRSDRQDRSDRRGDQRSRAGETGNGTWSIESLKKMYDRTASSSVPVKEEPKKPVLSSEEEFPDLGPAPVKSTPKISYSSKLLSAKTDNIQTDTNETSTIATESTAPKSIWGTKKEVIDTIKSSTMSEINDSQKTMRRKEKQQKYLENQEWTQQMALIKKKRDWLNRIKRQYSKDYNYRHIDDILRDEELEFFMETEIDREMWLNEQMLMETTSRQLRINTPPALDYVWYCRETSLCVLAEWTHSNEDYDVVEERVYRRV